MVRTKKSFRAPYLYLALLMTIVLSAWMIETVVANSVRQNTPATPGSAQLMSTTSFTGAFGPVLKADNNGRLLLAYSHNIGTEINHKYNPYFRESLDGGTTWSEPSPIQLGDENMSQVTFAFDSNNVAHAVWRTQDEIWHASENGWPSSINSNLVISTSGETVKDPDIAVAPDNTLHVVWRQGNKIFHSYSQNSGNNWSNPFELTSADLLSEVPAVAVDNTGNVHVVWQDRIWPYPSPKYHEVRYLKGTVSNQGISWDPSPTLVSVGIPDAMAPAIHIEDNNIHITFAYYVEIDVQYAYYVSGTLGSGFSSPIDISQASPLIMYSTQPFVLVSTLDTCNDKVYVLYHGALEENHYENIFGVDNGDNWSKRDPITTGKSRAILPSLACIGKSLHVAYEFPFVPLKNHQIYYIAEVTSNAVYLPTLHAN